MNIKNWQNQQSSQGQEFQDDEYLASNRATGLGFKTLAVHSESAPLLYLIKKLQHGSKCISYLGCSKLSSVMLLSL